MYGLVELTEYYAKNIGVEWSRLIDYLEDFLSEQMTIGNIFRILHGLEN